MEFDSWMEGNWSIWFLFQDTKLGSRSTILSHCLTLSLSVLIEHVWLSGLGGVPWELSDEASPLWSDHLDGASCSRMISLLFSGKHWVQMPCSLYKIAWIERWPSSALKANLTDAGITDRLFKSLLWLSIRLFPELTNEASSLLLICDADRAFLDCLSAN